MASDDLVQLLLGPGGHHVTRDAGSSCLGVGAGGQSCSSRNPQGSKGVEVEVDKAKDSFTHASQGLAGLGEGLLHSLGQSRYLPLKQDFIAPYKEDSWEHHEEMSTLTRQPFSILD